MKQKELTKTFMMISNKKNTVVSVVYTQILHRCEGWALKRWFFPIHLITYKYFHTYSAGIDFRRQNLTSTDVRFWRLKSIPALWGLITVVTLWLDELVLVMVTEGWLLAVTGVMWRDVMTS